MHLLYIHQYFKFPEESGGTRSYDLATSLVKKGIKVTIITSENNLKTSKKWRTINRDGIEVIYLNCPYSNNMGIYKRITSFFKFSFYSTLKALKIKADLVLATSTPLTIAFPALIKKKFNKTPFIFEARDIWPEVPIKMGIIKNRLLIYLLYKFEKNIYKKSDAIVVLSSGMFENIIRRLPSLKDKISIIPNISEINRFKNIQPTPHQLPFDHIAKKIVLYCGTFGKVNGISYMVDLAKMVLKKSSEIIFVTCGKGKELEEVLIKAKNDGVLNKNFFYIGVVPKQELPYLYSISTVGTSFVINNKILWDNSANKFFDTLAAHKPMIINHEGWQAETIRSHKCGFVLPAELNEEAINEFIEFINNDSEIKKAGDNAYNLAFQEFSLEEASLKYIKIIKQLGLKNQ